LHDAVDMALYFRSRMEGALGLCFRGDDLGEGDRMQMAHEIDINKKMRATLSVAAGALLTKQAAASGGPAWDVLQETAADENHLLLCAFQSSTDVDRFTVRPTGLDADTIYEVHSVDTGALGAATGAELMSRGIELIASPNTAAHIRI